MSPYEIDVLLWYHSRAGDYPDMFKNPPVWRPTVEFFKRENLLCDSDSTVRGDSVYRLTARGRCHAEALQSVPLPEATWITRWPNNDNPVTNERTQ